MSRVNLAQFLNFQFVPFEIRGPTTHMDVDEYVQVAKRRVEFRRGLDVGFGIGLAFDEEAATAS